MPTYLLQKPKKKKERQAYKNKGILRQPYLTFPA